nr:hypothetical protein [Candidatus Sigynarchaeota archaeon]
MTQQSTIEKQLTIFEVINKQERPLDYQGNFVHLRCGRHYKLDFKFTGLTNETSLTCFSPKDIETYHIASPRDTNNIDHVIISDKGTIDITIKTPVPSGPDRPEYVIAITMVIPEKITENVSLAPKLVSKENPDQVLAVFSTIQINATIDITFKKPTCWPREWKENRPEFRLTFELQNNSGESKQVQIGGFPDCFSITDNNANINDATTSIKPNNVIEARIAGNKTAFVDVLIALTTPGLREEWETYVEEDLVVTMFSGNYSMYEIIPVQDFKSLTATANSNLTTRMLTIELSRRKGSPKKVTLSALSFSPPLLNPASVFSHGRRGFQTQAFVKHINAEPHFDFAKSSSLYYFDPVVDIDFSASPTKSITIALDPVNDEMGRVGEFKLVYYYDDYFVEEIPVQLATGEQGVISSSIAFKPAQTKVWLLQIDYLQGSQDIYGTLFWQGGNGFINRFGDKKLGKLN